ncbi:MAG: hypothetical protein Q9181_006880 [Wetmoreana brouardii]
MSSGKEFFSKIRDRLPSRDRRKTNTQSHLHVADIEKSPSRVGSRVGSRTSLTNRGDPEVANAAHSSKSPQPTDASSTTTVEKSLWALAYEKLCQENPELTQKFTDCLEISTNGPCNAVGPGMDQMAHRALEEIYNIEDSKKHTGTVMAVRKYSRKAVEIVIASKSFIASAVSANPYAAIAWSGVSLLLPLLLNPIQEQEAAQKGLDHIIVLMAVYEWHEKTYLSDKDPALSNLGTCVIALYSMILEYEATLLVHLHKRSPSQWAASVLSGGEWSGLLSDIQKQDANCRDVASAIAGARTVAWRKEERQWQDELLQQPRQEEERRHIRMLYSNYEQGKNVNPERISGTCEWFLNHSDFLTWRMSQRSSLLWLSADPGCGKSVLSKFLVDRRGEVLTMNPETPTVCYFFFKDGDIDRMDGAKAICAILHQLILQHPRLYTYAKQDFEQKNEGFLADFDAMWNIFRRATEDPSSGEIICVLDALDECRGHSRQMLIDKLVQLYRRHDLDTKGKRILKFVVTSRPDFSIVRDFKPLTSTLSEVRLRGEEESEQISLEIDLVVRYKIEDLALRMDLNELNKSKLQEKLTSIPHRTYLWLYLTFDDNTKRLEFTQDYIAGIANTFPKNVDQAYTAILEKSQNKERARKLLHLILAAVRPLTVQEAIEALVIEERHLWYKDLDLWELKEATDKIKNICGLFVSVVDSKIYLIHQTAREFLLREEHGDSSSLFQDSSLGNWKKSFSITEANLQMTKACIWYLVLHDFARSELGNAYDSERYIVDFTFLSYAALNWAAHFTYAKSLPTPLIETVAYKLYDTRSSSFVLWSGIYHEFARDPLPIGGSDVAIASYFGHAAVVKLLLERKGTESDLHSRKDKHGIAPLAWAALNGHEAVVELLLEGGAQIDSKDEIGYTPLTYAVEYDHEAVVKLLLEHGAQVNTKSTSGDTPLLRAVEWRRKEIVELLLQHGAPVKTKSRSGDTPLLRAVEWAREEVVELLLQHGAQVNTKSTSGDTPLLRAVQRGREEVVELLLQHGAQVDWKDKYGRTPLSSAAFQGHKAVVELLLQHGAQVDLENDAGETPLLITVQWGRKAVVELLLQYGAQVDSKDKGGRTPLFNAALQGHKAVVELLLQHGAQVDLKDKGGGTPLLSAAFQGHKAVVELLLQYGAQVNLKDKGGRTPLSSAVFQGRKAVVELLLQYIAQVDLEDNKGTTPLSRAKQKGHDEVVKLLEEHLA